MRKVSKTAAAAVKVEQLIDKGVEPVFLLAHHLVGVIGDLDGWRLLYASPAVLDLYCITQPITPAVIMDFHITTSFM